MTTGTLDPARRRWILAALMNLRRDLQRRDRGRPGARARHVATARHAIYAATRHVYAGLAVIAAITLGIVLLTPRRFPVAGVADSR